MRVFLNRRHGVAINTGTSVNGVTHPVAPTDGGRIWRVDGPALHIPAAHGRDAVTQVTAMRPNPAVVFGGPGGANSGVVSADGGRHWYRAYLDGVVGAVVGDRGRLYALTGDRGAYVSGDRGRTWRHVPRFPYPTRGGRGPTGPARRRAGPATAPRSVGHGRRGAGPVGSGGIAGAARSVRRGARAHAVRTRLELEGAVEVDRDLAAR